MLSFSISPASVLSENPKISRRDWQIERRWLRMLHFSVGIILEVVLRPRGGLGLRQK
jgi:hypothetical protein